MNTPKHQAANTRKPIPAVVIFTKSAVRSSFSEVKPGVKILAIGFAKNMPRRVSTPVNAIRRLAMAPAVLAASFSLPSESSLLYTGMNELDNDPSPKRF